MNRVYRAVRHTAAPDVWIEEKKTERGGGGASLLFASRHGAFQPAVPEQDPHMECHRRDRRLRVDRRGALAGQPLIGHAVLNAEAAETRRAAEKGRGHGFHGFIWGNPKQIPNKKKQSEKTLKIRV